MISSDLLEAEAVNKLICPDTGKPVGIEYLWNTGETAILWFDEKYQNVRRHPLGHSAGGRT